MTELDRLLEMLLDAMDWRILGCVAGWVSEE